MLDALGEVEADGLVPELLWLDVPEGVVDSLGELLPVAEPVGSEVGEASALVAEAVAEAVGEELAVPEVPVFDAVGVAVGLVSAVPALLGVEDGVAAVPSDVAPVT